MGIRDPDLHTFAPDLDERERRRCALEALSTLFLDTCLDEADLRFMASRLRRTGYSRSELEAILWSEVFPALVGNLLSTAGEWVGFEIDRLEQQLRGRRPDRWRLAARLHPDAARQVQGAWEELWTGETLRGNE